MARFTPFHFIPVLIAAASHASEITVESRLFITEESFSATALPIGDCVLLRLSPKAWGNFEIVEIAEHGSKVKKGDVLVIFNSEEIDENLQDARHALESGAQNLAQAELDFKNLKEISPHKLEAIRLAAEIAKEENTYFTGTRRKSREETAAQSLKRYEQILSNQREELKQLTKMYEEEDITENTEEIILVRQQDAVAAAEFALRMEALEHKRTLEVYLPREAKKLADHERDTAIHFTKAQADIPRSIKLGELALEVLKTAHERAIQNLAELEADRTQFELKAVADGWFYHGPNEVIKHLVLHGNPPLHTAFATFMPSTAEFGLVSFLDEATARSITPDSAGIATLTGREELEISVKLLKLASAPDPTGTYRANLSVTWPENLTPVAGATAQVRFISYEKQAAIVIPTRALHYETSGSTVEVKLADGKTERRSVKCGHVSKDETEIISGLEVGQVTVKSDELNRRKSNSIGHRPRAKQFPLPRVCVRCGT
jgi:HlyD family secretion protein